MSEGDEALEQMVNAGLVIHLMIEHGMRLEDAAQRVDVHYRDVALKMIEFGKRDRP